MVVADCLVVVVELEFDRDYQGVVSLVGMHEVLRHLGDVGPPVVEVVVLVMVEMLADSLDYFVGLVLPIE